MEYLIHLPAQIGVALRGRRKLAGLTQAAAGGKVGLLPKTVSALENHPAASSLDSLFKLLSALDLEMVLRPKNTGRTNQPQGEW